MDLIILQGGQAFWFSHLANHPLKQWVASQVLMKRGKTLKASQTEPFTSMILPKIPILHLLAFNTKVISLCRPLHILCT